ncbi:HNH endonuclease [Microbacterium sp. R86528]|uniref:HNH endonuclease n=1 Tax=Microbacterium sp. R86528 TaxID=3093864 RepID=UPI0037C5DA06
MSRRLPPNWRAIRAAVLARDGQQCTWDADGNAPDHALGSRCTETGTGPGGRLEVDHIVPRYRGGTDEPDNLRTLCAFHHRERSARQKVANRASYGSRRAAGEAHPSGVSTSDLFDERFPGVRRERDRRRSRAGNSLATY